MSSKFEQNILQRKGPNDMTTQDAKVIKSIAFDPETEKDLLHFADSLPDFSHWVKEHIRKEMGFRYPQNPLLRKLIEETIAEGELKK